ncbi:hypothetical protein BDF14DRAFT_614327 [Spinellus fusiger]|nr:hypothetical protein BDF14DRAFT_614327 [Spinellus fusiger]
MSQFNNNNNNHAAGNFSSIPLDVSGVRPNQPDSYTGSYPKDYSHPPVGVTAIAGEINPLTGVTGTYSPGHQHTAEYNGLGTGHHASGLTGATGISTTGNNGTRTGYSDGLTGDIKTTGVPGTTDTTGIHPTGYGGVRNGHHHTGLTGATENVGVNSLGQNGNHTGHHLKNDGLTGATGTTGLHSLGHKRDAEEKDGACIGHHTDGANRVSKATDIDGLHSPGNTKHSTAHHIDGMNKSPGIVGATGVHPLESAKNTVESTGAPTDARLKNPVTGHHTSSHDDRHKSTREVKRDSLGTSEPTTTDKIKGNLQKLAGKITNDPVKIAEGEERATLGRAH